MKRCATFLAALAIASSSAMALADDAHHRGTEADGAASATAQEPLSQGQVRKVDKENGKVTIRHGALENLGMPAMTMVFPVKDAAMLEGLHADEQIRFRAEKVNGNLTVTQIEPVR